MRQPRNSHPTRRRVRCFPALRRAFKALNLQQQRPIGTQQSHRTPRAARNGPGQTAPPHCQGRDRSRPRQRQRRLRGRQRQQTHDWSTTATRSTTGYGADVGVSSGLLRVQVAATGAPDAGVVVHRRASGALVAVQAPQPALLFVVIDRCPALHQQRRAELVAGAPVIGVPSSTSRSAAGRSGRAGPGSDRSSA